MKAAVYTTYGPPEVLHIQQVDKPVPKDNQILVRIEATAVNSGDWRLRKADPFGVRLFFGLMKPKVTILGSVYSGTIEAAGRNVKLFKKGDEVFGHTDMHLGAYAQYLCVPESGTIAIKPKGISHPEAAVIPFGATTALHFIRKANIQPGQSVLVNGASGAVGSAAVQLAKYFGAKVTGVCSTANIDLVKSLGADQVIDYTKTDLARSGETYDIVFDTVNKIPLSDGVKLLNKNGILILSSAGMSEMLQGLWTSITSSRKVLTGVINHNADAIDFIKKLIDADKLKPVVDRIYPLSQIAEAHAYVEKGHKRGNVAISIPQTE